MAQLIGNKSSKKNSTSNSDSQAQPTRFINEIIVHCSESRPDQDITAADVNEWHRQKKWDCIGYHFFIKLDGTIEAGRPLWKEGAHCYGHNRNSIGICYAGGLIRKGEQAYYVDTRTPEQIRSLYLLIITLLHCYPSISKVTGHNEYSHKACPCFDAYGEYNSLVDWMQTHSFFP